MSRLIVVKGSRKLALLAVIAGLAATVALVGCGGTTSNGGGKTVNTSGSTATPAEKPLAIKATQIYSEYKANELAADGKYKDKLMVVSGTVTDISKDILDTPYINLKGDDALGSVQCMFTKEDMPKLAKVQKEKPLKIQGKCNGYSIMNVMLEECSIVEQK